MKQFVAGSISDNIIACDIVPNIPKNAILI